MPWKHELGRLADIPRDGTVIMVIRRGRSDAIPALWDREMGAFLGFDFAIFDHVSCWWPLPANIDPVEWQDGLEATS